MQIEIQLKPGSAIAKVQLEAGEVITSEGGAMIAMTNNMQIETTTRQKSGGGGIMSSIKRILASESIFFNHFTSQHTSGTIYLGTSLPGDMEVFELQGQKKLLVQAGSYVASSGGIQLNTVWQGAKNLLSGESFFWVELTGSGQAIINAFGVIYPIDVDGEYIVDTGHIVAFEDSLSFDITKAGSSWMSSFLGGEGFVCKFKGRGRVWCQSHSSNSWGKSMTRNLKAVKKS